VRFSERISGKKNKRLASKREKSDLRAPAWEGSATKADKTLRVEKDQKAVLKSEAVYGEEGKGGLP